MGAEHPPELAVPPLGHQVDVHFAQHRRKGVRVVDHALAAELRYPQAVWHAHRQQPCPQPRRVDTLQSGQRLGALGGDRLDPRGLRQKGAYGATALDIMRSQDSERIAMPRLHDGLDRALIGAHRPAHETSSAASTRSAIAVRPCSGMASQVGRFAAS